MAAANSPPALDQNMHQTKMVCHRGARLSAPENTFASAAAALDLGGSIIELDIRQSADGVLYVMHDESVARTTNGSGNICEMNSAEIDKLDAGSWFDPKFKGEQVPRLDAYLAEFAERAGFYLEIKLADCADVAKLVRKLGIAERCFTFSFNPQMRRDMLTHCPEVRRMVLWSYAGSVQAAREEHHAEIVEFHTDTFDPARIRECQDAGLEVMFYTDKPDETRFIEALRLKMNYVNIDCLALFQQLRTDRAKVAEPI